MLYSKEEREDIKHVDLLVSANVTLPMVRCSTSMEQQGKDASSLCLTQ